MTNPLRLPVSTRHAFALAYDLAVRRDPLQSLVVPFLLRAPWLFAMRLLPDMGETDSPGRTTFLWICAATGDAVATMVVGAMLRWRAKSVFETGLATRPAPALDCYARGIARLPWLFVTEVVRAVVILFGSLFLAVPGVYAAFRLGFTTEAVTLSGRNLAGGFGHSLRLTHKRFERWIELMAFSVAIVIASWLALAVVLFFARSLTTETWASVCYFLAIVLWPILHYAWAFFYLRLVEVEEPGIEVGPAYAAAPAEPPLAASEPALGPGAPQPFSSGQT